MENKVCEKCGVNKSVSEFYQNNSKNKGYHRKCKKCTSDRNKELYLKRIEAEKITPDTKICPKCNIVKSKDCFSKSSSSLDGLYRICKSCKKISAKKSRIKNKTRISAYNYQYQKNKRNDDPVFKLKDSISCLIRNSIKAKKIKKSTKTFDILGITYEEFKRYLEDNPYGFKINQKGLDIDHIVPISSAHTEKEVIKLNHYSNFQLLPKEYNRWVKKDKPFDEAHFKNWLKMNYEV